MWMSVIGSHGVERGERRGFTLVTWVTWITWITWITWLKPESWGESCWQWLAFCYCWPPSGGFFKDKMGLMWMAEVAVIWSAIAHWWRQKDCGRGPTLVSRWGWLLQSYLPRGSWGDARWENTTFLGPLFIRTINKRLFGTHGQIVLPMSPGENFQTKLSSRFADFLSELWIMKTKRRN